MKRTLGGDRLRSGNKMEVHLKGYERSTHDLSYLWRSTMSMGTLVPCITEIALPGDTFDIDLDLNVLTHPTLGPLFGSAQVAVDVFIAPMRLYHRSLQNNELKIGMNMSQIKLPVMRFNVQPIDTEVTDFNNCQINPSCILKYTGISGIGYTGTNQTRDFQALYVLSYWEIFKNYYANKQEEQGAVIHTPVLDTAETVTKVQIIHTGVAHDIPEVPDTVSQALVLGDVIKILYTGTEPNPKAIFALTAEKGWISLDDLSVGVWDDSFTDILQSPFRQTYWGDLTIVQWRYANAGDAGTGIQVSYFPLENIDQMRDYIMSQNKATAFNIFAPGLTPYSYLNSSSKVNSQEGLAIKTYKSDLFNNWLNTDWIDGTGGVNEISSIDVSSGVLKMDSLLFARKVYDYLNSISVSGGTYNDWLEITYDHQRYRQIESPMFMGGISRELVFQQVISNSSSGDQPLGTLAGRGILNHGQNGGKVRISVDEPGVIIGLVSITPRIDYSQGNRWDAHLTTMDDLHKPAYDEIGFQDLIEEQMAWWSTFHNGTTWQTASAGKQPAWINYMTEVNRVYGNFAIEDNEMFMIFNRRYQHSAITDPTYMTDLTTYIDPAKFNFIFAETALDSQNYWVQVAVNMEARRKMSAKIMPNL